jgi:CHAD domain-containing protein
MTRDAPQVLSRRMSTGPSTFLVAADDRDAVIDALAAVGFRFDVPAQSAVTLLDTFDGRFYRANLQLTLHEGPRLELVLAGDDVVEARVEPTAAPRFAADLPPGPFRTRVQSVTDVRVLLPQLRVEATRTDAACRNEDGLVVATAVLMEHVRLEQVGATVDQELSAAIEVHDVIGSRQPGRRAGEVLEKLGLVAVDGDALALFARMAGVELGGFEASATVPLDPATPAAWGVRDVLANLAVTIEANWQGTIDHLDPEFLHDLRIAVRRTRAVLTQTKNVLPPDVVAEAGDGFAWLGNLTGPARDLDVYLIEWDDYVRPLGGAAMANLTPVRALLEQRQAAAHATLDEAMTSPAAATLLETWRTRLGQVATHEHQGTNATRPLGEVVRRRMTRAQSKLIERGRLITPDSPAEQVHDLRKDAKKLRYLLECFGSLVADGPRKRFVKRLKALQDNLGEHQDAEVHVALIREIASDLHEVATSADTLLALGQLMERLEQIRIAARAEFAEQFAAYDTSATDHAFAAMLDFLDS